MTAAHAGVAWWSSADRGRAGPPGGALPPGERGPTAGPETAIRVFIVEDEGLIALDLSERLAGLGYEVCGSADRGEGAVPRIVSLRPDLVLLDVKLAGSVDGVDLARSLQRVIDVPVVFVTAYADPELIARMAQVRSCGYLVKPFGEHQLDATLQLTLARARADAASGPRDPRGAG